MSFDNIRMMIEDIEVTVKDEDGSDYWIVQVCDMKTGEAAEKKLTGSSVEHVIQDVFSASNKMFKHWFFTDRYTTRIDELIHSSAVSSSRRLEWEHETIAANYAEQRSSSKSKSSTLHCPCCKEQVVPDSSNFCGEGEVNHLTDHSECKKCGHCWACQPATGHYIYKELRDGEWLTLSVCNNVPNVCLEYHPEDSDEKINVFVEDEDNKHIVTCAECISSIAEMRAQQ